MASRRHRSRPWITALALASGVSQLGLIGSARAEEDTAAETAAARTLAVDGLKLAQAGKCDEAIPKLERAEKLHHSAIVLSRLGECQVSEGRLVEGTEMLRKVLREALPPNPSPALSKAYEHAQNSLDMAKPKIAGLTISVTAPQGTELHLTVDGQVVASTLLDSELPTDPGDHVIEASAQGFLKTFAHVSLGTADKKTVMLKLDADPNAQVAVPASASDDAKLSPPASQQPSRPLPPVTAPATPEAAPPAPNHAGAYASWSVGLVGVGVGAAFGLITVKDKHDLNGSCEANVCPASSRDAVAAAKRSGNVSTIAFAVGGAGLLLGTVLYFSIGSSSDTHEGEGTRHAFAGLEHGRALIGPGSVQLAADF